MLLRGICCLHTTALLLAVFGFVSVSPARATCDPDAPIHMVTVNNEGEQANNRSVWQQISSDGRFVSFVSEATNLVPNDTNTLWDAFVYDRLTCLLERTSVDSSGAPMSADSLSHAPISADGRYVFFASYDFGGLYMRDRLLQTTTRIDYLPGQSFNYIDAISADGRYISFTSNKGIFVPNDTNNAPDVFVHDRQTGQTERVSVASDGTQGEGIEGSRGGYHNLSADGRYVSFLSYSPNLVLNDTNNMLDVFVHDRLTGETTRVSVAADGSQAFGGLNSISGDGRYVTFISSSYNLVPEGNAICSVYTVPADCIHAYVKDRVTGAINRASQSSNGEAGDGATYTIPVLSYDGRYVAFNSQSNNLVAGDTNNTDDVFVFDRIMGRTHRVSVSASGEQTNGGNHAVISSDGRYVAYGSTSTNIVPGYGGSSQIFLADWEQIVGNLITRTPTPTRTHTVTPTSTVTPTLTPTVTTLELIANGDFSGGMAHWATWDAITHRIENGVFEFYRNVRGRSAALLQNTGAAVAMGRRLEASIRLGNASMVRKRVLLILHDADWSDLQVCSFWLPPNAALQTYRMHSFTTEAWSSTMVSIYSGDADGVGWIQVDGVSLLLSAAPPDDVTRCLDPRAPITSIQ
jgi:Tol biopolymer transport system component